MDDIGIASPESVGLQGHIDAVSAVLQVAMDHDLFFKLAKCSFHKPCMDYLGVILEKRVTRMDPVKISGIRDWPRPTKVRDVRSFLGFCNFYRIFIRGFATHARALNRLTRKDTEWHWGTDEEKSFETLKQLVTSEPVLAHPALTDQFELEVDASGFAVGAVLLQKKQDGKRHPIAYFSSTLNEAERNYDIYDLELLAIVKALRHWRPFLAGSPHKIKIFSDHLNLTHWKSPQKISRRVAREMLELTEYDFEIHHIKGASNGRADALSRRPDYDRGEADNEGVVDLPEQFFVRAMTVSPAEEPVQDEQKLYYWIDLQQLKKVQGTWYKNGRRVVTGNETEIRELIASHHDPPVYGHPGIAGTIRIIERKYWWPDLKDDVKEYIRGCAECQHNKINTRPIRAPLIPITPSLDATPFETVALDFITKLPKS